MSHLSPRLESRLRSIEERLKMVFDVLEMSPTITTFDWEDFNERDKAILNYLDSKGREGDTTPQIAEKIGLKNPEDSGRTIVYRHLKRIERISRRIKGSPIVSYDRKKWSLNYDVFQFPKPKTD